MLPPAGNANSTKLTSNDALNIKYSRIPIKYTQYYVLRNADNFIIYYLVVKLVKDSTGARFEYVSKKELNTVSVYCVGVCVFTQLRQISSLQENFSSDKIVKVHKKSKVCGYALNHSAVTTYGTANENVNLRDCP